MAEIATLARPYAEALFKASASDLTQTQSWLDAFALIASDAVFLTFAANPRVAADQVRDIFLESLQFTPPRQALNFLQVLIENRRLSVLPEIASQFRGLKNAAQGISDAVIYSAFPIEGDAFAELVRLLEKRFECARLNCRLEIDSSLIGGVRVIVGDEVFDASVLSRLSQMKAVLTA